MGIAEARKYIQQLHKRQENPDLWPDYLTGLPDKAAIIRRLEKVYPHIGRYAVSYVRITNIHPYLIKYGPDRHADIIQWAAAILKTTCEKCSKCFVGTVSTHDFVIMCETKNMTAHFKEAARIFRKKVEAFYSKEDQSSKTTLSFNKNGEKINIGLMGLKAVIADKKLNIKKSHLLQDMGKACEGIEGTGEDILVMNDQKGGSG
jgi:GGDEF domain-containing protein